MKPLSIGGLVLAILLSAVPPAYVTAQPSSKQQQGGAQGDRQKSRDAAKESTIAAGVIRYTPPEGWTKLEEKGEGAQAREVYVSPDRDGVISVEAPPGLTITKGTAAAVAKRVADSRKKAGKTVVMAAKVEPDDRFAVRVHEQYKQGERTADQLHLYRTVGPQAVMVTVNSVAADPAKTKKIHAAGEAVLASAEYTGTKAADKPATKPATPAKPKRSARAVG